MIFSRRRKADPTTAIDAFWTWWATARPSVEKAIDDGRWDSLVPELTARVTAIDPGLAWEFGAGGSTSKHLLSVTANGDRSLRSLAERWRRAGPAPDGTFRYAASRQATPSSLDAILKLDGREFDLAALRFAAEVDESARQADVRVWHPGFVEIPEPERVRIAFLALDWLLGEDGVEIWVREIDASAQAGPALTGSELAALVSSLASGDGEPSWALLTGTRDGRPLIATIQVPLKAARWPAADLHVHLAVSYRTANAGELPVDDSLAALRAFEDRLRASADGAVLAAHETTAGVRTYHLYADRQATVDALEPVVASWPEGPVRRTVRADPTWEGVRHLMP